MTILVEDIWFLQIRSEFCFPDFWKPLNSLVLMQAMGEITKLMEEKNVIIRQKKQLQQEMICLGRKPIWSSCESLGIVFVFLT